MERALTAYSALGELGQAIEDEWQYVADLLDAYAPSLEALRDGPPLSPGEAGAVDEAIAEIGLISDPHKAIDWLSTFPHVVGLAVGGDVDSSRPAEGGEFERAGAEPDEPDEDNPFAALLRRDR